VLFWIPLVQMAGLIRKWVEHWREDAPGVRHKLASVHGKCIHVFIVSLWRFVEILYNTAQALTLIHLHTNINNHDWLFVWGSSPPASRGVGSLSQPPWLPHHDINSCSLEVIRPETAPVAVGMDLSMRKVVPQRQSRQRLNLRASG
jgi:hypothetical protein